MDRIELLKELAKKIAYIEKTISSKSPEEKSKVEEELMEMIANNSLSLTDMMTIDDLVQEMLEQ